jgi:hypothetical protein
VYDDFDLAKVKENDEAWEARGHRGLVYDSDVIAYVRHIDAWRTPKRASLFAVGLEKQSSAWKLGDTFHAPLKGTGHVRDGSGPRSFTKDADLHIRQYAPSDPYGGTEDFDVSATSIVYTAKDTNLLSELHTKQNVRAKVSQIHTLLTRSADLPCRPAYFGKAA